MNDSNNHNRESDLDALLEELPPEQAKRLREVWELAGEAEPTGDLASVNTEDALLGVLERGEPPSTDNRKREGRSPQARERFTARLTRSWPTITSALALFLAVGLIWNWWQQPITRSAPLGERLALTLPDGSEVELNSGSSICYASAFGEVRAVRLEGEAFFDVSAGSRPFVVRTFNADVRALGTSFNVAAWPDGRARSTFVTLVEGQVELSARTRSRTATLSPGETRQVRTGQSDSIPSVDVSVEDATAWRRGDLIVKDRPLGEVFREVERRFAVELTVRPSSLGQQRINLALRSPKSGEAVVRDLSRALGLRYRETSNGFELYK